MYIFSATARFAGVIVDWARWVVASVALLKLYSIAFFLGLIIPKISTGEQITVSTVFCVLVPLGLITWVLWKTQALELFSVRGKTVLILVGICAGLAGYTFGWYAYVYEPLPWNGY